MQAETIPTRNTFNSRLSDPTPRFFMRNASNGREHQATLVEGALLTGLSARKFDLATSMAYFLVGYEVSGYEIRWIDESDYSRKGNPASWPKKKDEEND